MGKGRVFWLDEENYNPYPRITLQNAGYYVLYHRFIYEAFPNLEKLVRNDQEFELVVVNPVTSMIAKESRALYNHLRQTRFLDLPELPDSPVEHGRYIVELLIRLLPETPIMVLSWYNENTDWGRKTLEELRANPNIVRIIEKTHINHNDIAEEVGLALAEAQARKQPATS